MEYFDLDGRWWPSNRQDVTVAGKLIFDEDGIRLIVDGVIDESDDSGQAPTATLTLHGRSFDGERITLFRAEDVEPSILGNRVTYLIRLAVKGAHLAEDSFIEAWCELDCLDAWADPPSLLLDENSRARFTFRWEHVVIDEATVDRAQIRLVAGVSGSVGPARIDVHQQAAFRISFPDSSLHRLLDEWVRPLTDLVTFCLDRPVRITQLRLRPPAVTQEDHQRLTLFGPRFLDAFFPAVQALPSHPPTRESIRHYTEPTLLTYPDSPIPFDQLIPRWFSARTKMRDVFVHLTGPYHARYMFDEHRYSSAYQSAEHLAKKTVETKEKTDDEHSARVHAVISAAEQAGVEPETIAWVSRVIQNRNDKPLKDIIDALVRSTGKVGAEILDASPQFGYITTKARAGVSHPGLGKRLWPDGRYWHAVALRWVVRARLLMELGVSLEEVEARVLGKDSFKQMIEKIRMAAQ